MRSTEYMHAERTVDAVMELAELTALGDHIRHEIARRDKARPSSRQPGPASTHCTDYSASNRWRHVGRNSATPRRQPRFDNQICRAKPLRQTVTASDNSAA